MHRFQSSDEEEDDPAARKMRSQGADLAELLSQHFADSSYSIPRYRWVCDALASQHQSASHASCSCAGRRLTSWMSCHHLQLRALPRYEACAVHLSQASAKSDPVHATLQGLELDFDAVVSCIRSLPLTTVLGLPEDYDLSRAADVQPPEPAAAQPSRPQHPAPATRSAQRSNAAAVEIIRSLGLPSAPAPRPVPAAAERPATSTAAQPAALQPQPQPVAVRTPPAPARTQAPPQQQPASRHTPPDADLDALLGASAPAVLPQTAPAGASSRPQLQQQARGQRPSRKVDAELDALLAASAPEKAHASQRPGPQAAAADGDSFDDFLKSL